MADVNGTTYGKFIDPSPGNILDPGECGGRVRCITESYTATPIATGASILLGGTLPTGARIVEVILSWTALGASATATVGDAGDADRYLTTLNIGTAGSARLNAATGFNYKVTGTTDNVIKFATAGATAATGTVKAAIFYAID